MPADDHGPEHGQPSKSSSPGPEQFRIGAPVDAGDGACGELTRVIVDPIAQALTHLVVAPAHHRGLGRLVPIELVEGARGDRIHLRCKIGDFEQLDRAEDVRFLPTTTGPLGYGSHALMWPYYGLGMPLGGQGLEREPILIDRVPVGEVEVHRGDQVHAADGWIGSVQGLVIDPNDHHVTHVLLQEGHLWGRRQVAIPIGAASRVGEEIRVTLTKQQVQELPPVQLSSSP